jgi:hypothetical protein
MDYRLWTIDYRLSLNIELELEISFVAADLQRLHGDDLRAIKRPDEFIPANAKLALTWFDLVVLHPAGFVSHGAVNPLAMDRDRGGDVAHRGSQKLLMKSRYNMAFCFELYCARSE